MLAEEITIRGPNAGTAVISSSLFFLLLFSLKSNLILMSARTALHKRGSWKKTSAEPNWDLLFKINSNEEFTVCFRF